MDPTQSANPFKMPTDQEVFRLRDEEKRQKNLEREALKYKRVHEKTTWSARIGSANMQTTLGDSEYSHSKEKSDVRHMDVQLPGVDIREKDNMAVYIKKKREMGLMRMSLATKRQEIKKLDEEADRAEKRIRQQEDQLEETNQKFEDFLKHSNLEQVTAKHKAENESKQRVEKISEIKKLGTQIASIDTEKKKHEDQLGSCLFYKEFLDDLTPKNHLKEALFNIWCEDARRELTTEMEIKFNETLSEGATDAEEQERRQAMLQELETKYQERVEAIHLKIEGQEDETSNIVEAGLDGLAANMDREVDEEKRGMSKEELNEALDKVDPDRVPMYWNSTDKILAQFIDIEDGNLLLINNCQELEDEIEEIGKQYMQVNSEMQTLAKQRQTQMEAISMQIQVEVGKMKAMLERIDRAKQQNVKQSDAKQDLAPGEKMKNSQEIFKNQIEEKVKSIFRTLGLGDGSDQEALPMLTHVEMKLEEMRHYIKDPENGIEAAFVQSVMKARDKDRRQAQRQVLLNNQKEEREKRSQKAISRARDPIKKRVGKPVMWRSRPPDTKKEEVKQEQEQVDEDEELFL